MTQIPFFREAFIRKAIWLFVGAVLGASSTSAKDFLVADFDIENPPQGLLADDWMNVEMMGQKVGYVHLVFRREGDWMINLTRTEMAIGRGETQVKMTTISELVTTVEGEPVRFELTNAIGGDPIVSRGTFEDGEIVVETEPFGRPVTRRYPIEGEVVMGWETVRKTLELPEEPGAEMVLQFYDPSVSFSEPYEATLRVVGEETLELDGKSIPAYRVDTIMQMQGIELPTQSWVGLDGAFLMSSTRMGGFDVRMTATTENEALRDFVPPDLFSAMTFQLGRSIPPDAEEVVYRLTFDEPPQGANAWLRTPAQTFEAVSETEFSFTVQRGGPKAGIPGELADAEPYLGSNFTLDFDDPVVRAQYELAGIPPGLGFEQADELRKFVSGFVGDDFSVGFATASQVCRNPNGDCSEHAVLLAALGRMHGFPTRVVAGLVYIPKWLGQENVMGYHMWTQFWIDGQWVDLDAAVPESITSPIRIGFAASDLMADSIAEHSFGLLDSFGQLEIEVLSVK